MSNDFSSIDDSIIAAIERCRTAQQKAAENGLHVMPEAADNDEPTHAIPTAMTLRLKRAGIEPDEAGCRFENYHGNDNLIKRIKDIGDNENLVLCGPSGCGKTHLAISIMVDYAERHPDDEIVFIGVPILMINIKYSFTDKSALTEKEMVDYYCSVPLLVLDDLGQEQPTDYAVSTLFAILYQRNRRRCKTVITSNLTIKQLGKHLRSMGAESRLASGRQSRSIR